LNNPNNKNQKTTSCPLARIVGHFIDTQIFNILPLLHPLSLSRRKIKSHPPTQKGGQSKNTQFLKTHSALLGLPLTLKRKNIKLPMHPPK
jgi:hypothetical protein